jgi:hypothetical protein
VTWVLSEKRVVSAFSLDFIIIKVHGIHQDPRPYTNSTFGYSNNNLHDHCGVTCADAQYKMSYYLMRIMYAKPKILVLLSRRLDDLFRLALRLSQGFMLLPSS